MNVEMNKNIIQVIVLDISGVYARICDQGYFERTVVDDIKKEFSDEQHWRVVVVDRD